LEGQVRNTKRAAMMSLRMKIRRMEGERIVSPIIEMRMQKVRN